MSKKVSNKTSIQREENDNKEIITLTMASEIKIKIMIIDKIWSSDFDLSF